MNNLILNRMGTRGIEFRIYRQSVKGTLDFFNLIIYVINSVHGSLNLITERCIICRYFSQSLFPLGINLIQLRISCRLYLRNLCFRRRIGIAVFNSVRDCFPNVLTVNSVSDLRYILVNGTHSSSPLRVYCITAEDPDP